MPTRRDFVSRAGLAAFGMLAAACGGGDATTAPPGSSEVRIPLPAEGATLAIAPRSGAPNGIAVTRTGAATVVAVSRRCTHQGCTVGLPASPGGTLDCPCHGSRFQTDGRVVNGPAASPLRSFAARIEGDEVVVTVA